MEERTKILMPTTTRRGEQVEPRRQPLAEMLEEGPPVSVDNLLRLLARPLSWSERSMKLGEEIERLQDAEKGLIEKARETSAAIVAIQGEVGVEALRSYLGLGRGSGYSQALGRLRGAEEDEVKYSLALKACRDRLQTLPPALRASMSQDVSLALQKARDEAEEFRAEFLRSFATPEAGCQTPSSAAKRWSDLQLAISGLETTRNRLIGLPERPPQDRLLIQASDLEGMEREGRHEAAELLALWGRELSF